MGLQRQEVGPTAPRWVGGVYWGFNPDSPSAAPATFLTLDLSPPLENGVMPSYEVKGRTGGALPSPSAHQRHAEASAQ